MKNWIKNNWLWLVLIILFLTAFLDLYSWLWKSIFFIKDKDGVQNLLLLGAFEAAFYYALTTHKLWQIEKDPVLRLQWHDIGSTDQALFKKYKEIIDDKNYRNKAKQKTIQKIYNAFTDLQLVNDGKSSAKDLTITVKYKNQNKVIEQLKNVTAVGPKEYTQLKYLVHPGQNRHKVFNDEKKSYVEPFVIIINYKDSQNLSHGVEFESDEHYNDGFKII